METFTFPSLLQKKALLKTATPLVYNSKTTDLTFIQDDTVDPLPLSAVLGTTDLTLIQDGSILCQTIDRVLGTTDLTLIQDPIDT